MAAKMRFTFNHGVRFSESTLVELVFTACVVGVPR